MMGNTPLLFTTDSVKLLRIRSSGFYVPNIVNISFQHQSSTHNIIELNLVSIRFEVEGNVDMPFI
jgi:hypothetical protein